MAIPRKDLSIHLAAFLKDQSFGNDATGPGTCQLVMLRGCIINADGSLSLHLTVLDQYSDVMVAFGQKAGGQPYLECFVASARPGLYWIQNPQYSSPIAGCPSIVPGQFLYQRGLHPSGGTLHEAMVQAAQVCVIRDYDDDAQVDPTEALVPDYPRWTGINIHAGGTGKQVGPWSSGCQIIKGGWKGNPWDIFHDLVYRVAKGQALFHYTVADFAMFAEWHDAPVGRPKSRWIMYGSQGSAVLSEQKVLAHDGYLGTKAIDGKFGPDTDLAVRCWQRAQGQKVPNGIVRF